MEELAKLPIEQLLLLGLMSALASIVMGRTLKRVLYWAFRWIARKTGTKKDDELLPDVRKDLGLEESESDANETK